MQVVIEPKPAYRFVSIIKFTQIDACEIFLGKPSVVDHEGIGGKQIKDLPSELPPNAVHKHTLVMIFQLAFDGLKGLRPKQLIIACLLQLFIVLRRATDSIDPFRQFFLPEHSHQHFARV